MLPEISSFSIFDVGSIARLTWLVLSKSRYGKNKFENRNAIHLSRNQYNQNEKGRPLDTGRLRRRFGAAWTSISRRNKGTINDVMQCTVEAGLCFSKNMLQHETRRTHVRPARKSAQDFVTRNLWIEQKLANFENNIWPAMGRQNKSPPSAPRAWPVWEMARSDWSMMQECE